MQSSPRAKLINQYKMSRVLAEAIHTADPQRAQAMADDIDRKFSTIVDNKVVERGGNVYNKPPMELATPHGHAFLRGMHDMYFYANPVDPMDEQGTLDGLLQAMADARYALLVDPDTARIRLAILLSQLVKKWTMPGQEGPLQLGNRILITNLFRSIISPPRFPAESQNDDAQKSA